MLELRNITKRFGAVLANDGVSFTVKPGTIHAIVVENGAGLHLADWAGGNCALRTEDTLHVATGRNRHGSAGARLE